VLADLEGAPLLERLLRRLSQAKQLDRIAVATSTAVEDDDVEAAATAIGVAVVRGPLDDVLGRYRIAAEKLGANAVVRITADCPLVDPGVIDVVVERFLAGNADYVSNAHPPTYPDGLDVEVLSTATLELAAREAHLEADREHVTLFVHRQPERFSLENVEYDRDLSDLRWTVDYEDDLHFVREVYRALLPSGDGFTMQDVLALLEREPRIAALMPSHSRSQGVAHR
jgi:spore coat polysaccharide biosynthesis protein SpsF